MSVKPASSKLATVVSLRNRQIIVMETVKKTLHVEIEKALDSGADARFVMSATSPDRVNDTIAPEAYAPTLQKEKIIALFDHDSSRIVGYWKNFQVKAGKLVGELFLSSVNLGQMLKQLIADGVPLGASIGFMATGSRKDNGGFHFEEIDILETSIVAVPAHPKALLIAKQFGIDLATGKKDPAAVSGKSSKSKPHGARAMNLAERIQQQEKNVQDIQDELDTIETQIDEDMGNDDLLTQHAEKTAALKQASDYLVALQDREAAAVERAKETENKTVVKGVPAFRSTGNPLRMREPKACEVLAVKAAIAIIAFEKGMSRQAVAETFFKGDKLHDFIAKTAVQVGDTTTTGTYLELVQNDTRGLIAAMRPTSVAAALSALGVQDSFNGFNQIIRPYETGNDDGASWVGEVGHIPLSHAPVGKSTFDQYKLATIVPYSIELLERSVVGLVEFLRNAIIAKFSKRLDQTLLSAGAAIAGVRPAGLLNGVTPLTPTAGGGQDALIGDISQLMSAAVTANTVNLPTLLMNEADRIKLSMMTGLNGTPLYADDLAQGRLGQIRVVSSNHVPADSLTMVQAGWFLSAFETPEFMISREATLVMANADNVAPTHSIDNAGVILTAPTGLGDVLVDGGIPVKGGPTGAGTVGAVGLNLYQTYSEALRGVMPATYGMLRANAVGTINGVTWA